MTSVEFVAHLRQAADEKWSYKKSGAQYDAVDCVGLYKCIMEWYYQREVFHGLITITEGEKQGRLLNQVNDLRQYGIRWGQVFHINDYEELLIGCAVFVYDPTSKMADSNNLGWIHVGYYVGDITFINENGETVHYSHGVVEAVGRSQGVKYSDLENSSFNFWGLLNGIDY